jgi:hypothetical protein
MIDLLPGEIAYVFIIAVLDAALLSWLALRWYRRSVFTLMQRRDRVPIDLHSQDVSEATSSAPDSAAVPAQLTFVMNDGPASVGVAGTKRGRMLSAHRGRVVIAYGAGAALYSLVVTTAMMAVGGTQRPIAAWFAVWWAHGWLIVPTLITVLVLERARAIGLAAAYVVTGSVLVSIVTLANQIVHGRYNTAPITNMYGVVQLIGVTALFPLCLVLLTAWRRIRGVMPLALAATVLFGLASIFFRQALINAFNEAHFRTALLDLSAAGSADITNYGLFMLVALPVGWIAWQVLRRIAGLFARKRFSDVQLVVDCWWVTVAAAVIASDLIVAIGAAGIAAGVAAFAVYRLSVAGVLRRVSARPTRPIRLLLLRVFGYQARTESLFDGVAQRWRFRGPVCLIAGVDLAARTADPGDMLALLGRRLAAQYIASADQVPERVARLDERPDPDGRFRVNKLFCRDDTWRSALEGLLDTSDVVLMDLRSFSAQNAGCIFELEQLVCRVPTDRIVLVCDRTTDLGLLESTLGQAWSRSRGDGRARGSGTIALVRVERQNQPERRRLLASLVAAAPRVVRDEEVAV